jgi:hypothetical protein
MTNPKALCRQPAGPLLARSSAWFYPGIGSPSHNGRETLGLRPALRQAAPGRRRGRGGREATATRQRGSGFGQSHDKPPAGDSLREFVLRSLHLRPWRHSGRGLPTRHSLRERRLPLDVGRKRSDAPSDVRLSRPGPHADLWQLTSSIVPRLGPRSRALGTPFRPATCNESAL